MLIKDVKYFENGNIGGYIRSNKNESWKWRFINKKILKSSVINFKDCFEKLIVLLKNKRDSSSSLFNTSYKSMIKHLMSEIENKKIIDANDGSVILTKFEAKYSHRIQKSKKKHRLFTKNQKSKLTNIEIQISKIREELTKEKKEKRKINKYRYIIIGAGPVGLYTSIKIIQNNLLSKDDKLLIIEKYHTFTREQILLVNQDTQQLLKFLDLDNTGCYIFKPDINKKSYCYLKKKHTQKPLFSIMTNKLQKALLNYLMIKYSKYIDFLPITDWNRSNTVNHLVITRQDTNITETIKFDFLIGADGFNSKVRKELLKLDNVFEKRYQSNTYGVVLILNTINNNDILFKKNRLIPNNIPTTNIQNKQDNYRLFFDRDGTVYIALQISSSIFPELEFKNTPISDFFKVNDKLKKFINKKILNNISTLDDLILKKVSWFNLELGYFNENAFYNITNNKKNILLVGDALYGTNFFSGSGLNIGLCFVDILIKFLKDNIKISHDNYNKDVKYNNNYTIIYNNYINHIYKNIDTIKQINKGRVSSWKIKKD